MHYVPLRNRDRNRVRVTVRVIIRGRGYFLRLHTPFSIPQLMQRVRHQGDCHGISAATEWDPTAMMLGRWRLNPLSHYKTVWPPLQGH